jgi:hypothetical protein
MGLAKIIWGIIVSDNYDNRLFHVANVQTIDKF